MGSANIQDGLIVLYVWDQQIYGISKYKGGFGSVVCIGSANIKISFFSFVCMGSANIKVGLVDLYVWGQQIPSWVW